MLHVCSAAPICSSQSTISFHVGTRAFCSLRRLVQDRSIVDYKPFLSTQDVIPAQNFKQNALKCMHSLVSERPDQSCQLDSSILSPYPNEFDDVIQGFSTDYFGAESESLSYNMRDITSSSYIEPQSVVFLNGDELVRLPDTLHHSSNGMSESTFGLQSASNDVINTISKVPLLTSNLQESIEHFISGVSGSLRTSIDRAEGATKSIYDAFTFTASDKVKGVTESFDDVVSGLFSSVDSTFSSNMHGAGIVVIDILRRAIVSLENSLESAATFVIYYYGSAKSFLPLDIRNVLDLSEEKITAILKPVSAAFEQAYIVIEGFERTIGLDLNDPIVPFIIFLGSSATIGTSLWLFTYGGYSGDLDPEMTIDVLKNEENAVLIDVRPEVLRERDGVPDLRRGARSKYASVIFPEVKDSLRKMLKSGKEIDESLIAVVIRNLKIVKNESKVIIMDDNGSQSKAIARSLKKLGVKKPYMLRGGFRSWVKKGLRIKELKPESTLTLLNEEVEAILEDVKLSPTLVVGLTLGISGAVYALLDWEKTLQVIGIIGLGQTLYRRFASYEDTEDLKQDVRQLLAPVRLGAEAFSWAARKIEPIKVGLPTSPSSNAVQDRVLQAAAKHESQPPDREEAQGLLGQMGENTDLSEA